MYRDYVKEKESLETLQTDVGFAAYRICPITKIMDIGDFYIKPECRTGLESTRLFNKVKEVAKDKGVNRITCCVVTTHQNPEQSLYVVVRHKFKISHVHDGVIYFYQNI
jgi:N-acetylglutamate synthase-like GNAT family acetyltransferase